MNLVGQLHETRCLGAAHNAGFLGGPGTGKTHLATSLGDKAIRRHGKPRRIRRGAPGNFTLPVETVLVAHGDQDAAEARFECPLHRFREVIAPVAGDSLALVRMQVLDAGLPPA